MGVGIKHDDCITFNFTMSQFFAFELCRIKGWCNNFLDCTGLSKAVLLPASNPLHMLSLF